MKDCDVCSDVWPCWGMMVGEDECFWLAGSRHFCKPHPTLQTCYGRAKLFGEDDFLDFTRLLGFEHGDL